MTMLANKHSAVNLGQGFPNFNPRGALGARLLECASEEITRGNKNQYCRSYGVMELCQAVRNQFAKEQRIEFCAESEVTVFSGATEALFATLAALLNPGDNCILFQPHYDSYKFGIDLMRANAKVVTLHPDSKTRRFTFNAQELERAFECGPKALVLNTPHNPTGTVFSRQELEQISALCIKHDCIVISDEVYEHITFDPSAAPHVSIAQLPGMRDRTVCISSAGKTFSVTGWKVGWALANREISQAIRTCHQFITFSTSTPFQYALARVMQDEAPMQEFLFDLRADYKAKRDKLCEGLARAGLSIGEQPPQGGYFALVDISQTKQARAAKSSSSSPADVQFAKWLTKEAGVCVIPNSAFYSQPASEANNFVRFAFCKTDDMLDAGLARLGRIQHLF